MYVFDMDGDSSAAAAGADAEPVAEHLARVLWTAGSAGCVTIATTLAIELLGGPIGAALGSCPHVIVVATIGFYVTYGDSLEFTTAACALPVGVLAGTAIQGVLWTFAP